MIFRENCDVRPTGRHVATCRYELKFLVHKLKLIIEILLIKISIPTIIQLKVNKNDLEKLVCHVTSD